MNLRHIQSLQKIGRDLGQEWLLKENFVLSFHNLREPPWTEICDLELSRNMT
jgi:hypothetical protein